MMISKQKLIILYTIAVVSLLLGALLYLFFRESTYISKWFFEIFPHLKTSSGFFFLKNNFTKYYFADFLWSASFSSWLHIIVLPKPRGSVKCAIFTGIFGLCFEVMQKFDVISGTADFWDVILYNSAGMLISIIYSFKKKEKNK